MRRRHADDVASTAVAEPGPTGFDANRSQANVAKLFADLVKGAKAADAGAEDARRDSLRIGEAAPRRGCCG